MKKASKSKHEPEMQKEYDFSRGVRGKYHKRFMASSNVVVIDAELSKIFPDSKSVNLALRSLVSVAKKSAKPTKAR
jgi:thymidylate kinase